MSLNKIKSYLFAGIVLITIIFGWKFPLLGFVVPVVMMTALTISLFEGRHHCGNTCPRGMFLNLSLNKFSKNNVIPLFFKDTRFRVFMLVFMFSFMTFMISRNPENISHWGRVFWMMCLWTTVLGIILGLFFRPRIWCSFCPIGTMQMIIGKRKSHIKLNSITCKSCKICEKRCPLNLQLISKQKSLLLNKDCINCSVCIQVCPAKALS